MMQLLRLDEEFKHGGRSVAHVGISWQVTDATSDEFASRLHHNPINGLFGLRTAFRCYCRFPEKDAWSV